MKQTFTGASGVFSRGKAAGRRRCRQNRTSCKLAVHLDLTWAAAWWLHANCIKIIKGFRLEKIFQFIKSSCKPSAAKSTTNVMACPTQDSYSKLEGRWALWPARRLGSMSLPPCHQGQNPGKAVYPGLRVAQTLGCCPKFLCVLKPVLSSCFARGPAGPHNRSCTPPCSLVAAPWGSFCDSNTPDDFGARWMSGHD